MLCFIGQIIYNLLFLNIPLIKSTCTRLNSVLQSFYYAYGKSKDKIITFQNISRMLINIQLVTC